MKTLKVLLQEVVSGIKAWVNSNFAQESNTVHKTGNETVNGVKTFNDNVYTFSAFRQKVSGITDKNAPSSGVSAGTVVVAGNDGTYWGGLTHQWTTEGDSTTIVSVSNWREVNNAWSQGYWECRLTASKDFSTISFYPSDNINFGTSTNQWKSVYAQTYYYNGVAWGLDKANVWTQSQTIKNTDYQIGEVPSATKAVYLNFTDKNNVNIGWLQRRLETNGDSSIEMFVYNRFTNSQPDTAGTQDYAMLKVGLKSDQTRFCEITGDTYPRTSNTYNLGTSTNKWKTINGVNPGALSLPNYTSSIAQDVSGEMVPEDNSGNCRFNPIIDGWLYVDFDITNATLFSGSQEAIVQAKDNSVANASHVVNFFTCAGGTHIFVYMPVLKGKLVILQINFTGYSIGKAYVYQCQGNVPLELPSSS